MVVLPAYGGINDMRVRTLAVLAAAAITVPVMTLSSATAAAPDGAGPWADSVTTVKATKRFDGSAVPATRNDPKQALGVPENTKKEGTFYSTGFGGSVTFGFVNNICNTTGADLDVDIREVTFTPPDPNYPAEPYLVEVAKTATGPWVSVGTPNRDATLAIPGAVGIYKFVRITDKTAAADFQNRRGTTPDGVDIDGIRALNTNCSLPPFNASASTLRAGVFGQPIEPITANPPFAPCAAASDDLLTLPFNPLLAARVLSADTTCAPTGPTAQAAVANLSVGLVGASATGVSSGATVSCNGTTPVLTGTSTIASISVGGQNLANVSQPIVIPVPGVATVYLNRTVISPDGKTLTQRAIEIDVVPAFEGVLSDVVVAESKVGVGSNALATSCG